jgi:HD-like signal output (HDOD) protein
MITVSSTTRTRLITQVRPFRPVALQLSRMVGDPSVPFGKVADLLQTDPVLSADLLRIANSPLFPSRMEISSVLRAIVFLGSDMVSALVLTTCLKSLVAPRADRFIMACWRHSLATALVCQHLSDAMSMPSANGYTAGLIHDIGQMALLNAFPAYAKALVAAEEGGLDPMDVERELFGLDHCEAGNWLLAQWDCPVELQRVAAEHENPPRPQARNGDLIRLVHGASAMANLMGMSLLESPGCVDLSQIATVLPEASCELTVERFGELTERVMTKVNGVELSLTSRLTD